MSPEEAARAAVKSLLSSMKIDGVSDADVMLIASAVSGLVGVLGNSAAQRALAARAEAEAKITDSDAAEASARSRE